MCARRFLIAVLVLTVIAVAGAFAIFQFGQQVLIKQATPKGHFEVAEAGRGPDYSDISNWVARPGLAEDPSRWRPVNDVRVDPITIDARVFYIHPTTYLARDRWNAPLHAGADVELRTRLFVQSQASAFGQDAEIWAPRYRQAAYGAFLLRSEDARKALELAYSDLAAAFDDFLRQVPKESPIILAGHSQGSLHLIRLLQEKKAELRGRLIAAYVVGWPVDTRADLPALGFPACRAAVQTGCILSWLSFAEPANPSLILGEWEKTEGAMSAEHERERILCVNPLTGTEGGSAPPDRNPGTLVPSSDMMQATLEPGRVGAHCEKGLLILDGEIPLLGPYVLPGNNFHVYDYALFWGAIRQDAERRLRAWQRR